jgi:hypothetical protein
VKECVVFPNKCGAALKPGSIKFLLKKSVACVEIRKVLMGLMKARSADDPHQGLYMKKIPRLFFNASRVPSEEKDGGVPIPFYQDSSV